MPDDLDLDEARRYRLRRQRPRWYDPIKKFWTRQISVTVSGREARDHLALERTFLGYLRTAVMISMAGTIIAQFFRLQHSVNPDVNLGYFVVGTPLAAVFVGSSVVVVLVGAFRFWRQQNAMVRGKVHAGGWEISLIMVWSVVVCIFLFGTMVGIPG
ncbi:hypothetical protein BDY21DRAFT_281242 [Lineolata rhizophorae]|uniref:DUF202 domain-containing protein n=1 Tax=Lineolata rhizophorae TaxID=578093 RepID=A0A6A6P7B9_9PEZI|nr:hypothetical protein BDY21DRAFT_281242 [Lineolata rhizophorae]